MEALAKTLSPYLVRLFETSNQLTAKNNVQGYYKLHKETADRILKTHHDHYAKILALEHPITEQAVYAAFTVISNLLYPEANIGAQYELAQKAHDCRYI